MRGPTQHLWINYDDQMVTLWLHLHTEIGFPPQSTHSEELVHFYWERIFCNFHRILKLEMSELSFWCYSVGFFSEFQPLFSFTALPFPPQFFRPECFLSALLWLLTHHLPLPNLPFLKPASTSVLFTYSHNKAL